MSNQKTSKDTDNATSSPESGGGRLRFGWRDGRKIGSSGPDHVPVSRFRALDREKDMPINDTCGPLFNASSPSAALQLSLESRLRARMDVNGSVEYALTWSTWDMLAGVPICRLRASARRTSGSGFGGWPTPRANEIATDAPKRQGGPSLSAVVAGWPTLNVPTGGQGTGHAELKGATYRNKDCQKVQLSLQAAAILAGWPTPVSTDAQERKKSDNDDYLKSGKVRGGYGLELKAAVQLADWHTPRVSDSIMPRRDVQKTLQLGFAQLRDQAIIAGWPTPLAQERPDRPGSTGAPRLTTVVLGLNPTSFPAATKKRGALNPEHCRWLMGFPVAFATSAQHSDDWLLWQALMAPVSAEQRAIGLGLSGATGTRLSRK